MKYVAFLRGINVGGKSIVKMDQLKKILEGMGFTGVKTLLNSGNVIFEADEKKDILTEKIAQKLKEEFGWEIGTIIRTQQDIIKIEKIDPFKNIKVTPETRLYVTFLAEKPDYSFKIPYESEGKEFKILEVTDGEIFSVLTITPDLNTTKGMGIIEKEFGKKVTTRNWNTVLKIAKA